MEAKGIHLMYSYSHFFNFVEQIASRLQDHKTTGNIVCHLIAAPLLGKAFFDFLVITAGTYTASLLTLVLCTWCISNDLSFGLIYCIYCAATTYMQLYCLAPPTLLHVVVLALFTVVIQLGVGHGLFERRPPNELEGVVKGDGKLFSVLDLLCEIVPGTFHFYSIAALKLGFRPSLHCDVTVELSRIEAIIKKAR